MSDITVRVENLGKMYRIGAAEKRSQNLWQAAKGMVASPFEYLRRISRPPTEEETMWALRDVSFEVQRGEVVGIIGRNGAGKSTLLKILSHITEPTEGRAVIHGRVGSLLEVGTGFHPELTGRENIYLNGAILGMKKVEIERKFDEIVDFAEIEKFIDTPVKRYSSGMYVRLGFAVAAHLDHEILLVDEVLAVGDAAFQNKCLGKIENVVTHGRTVLLVSHNMTSILNLCKRAILVDGGHMMCDGDANVAVDRYLASNQQHNEFVPQAETQIGGARARIEDFEVRPKQPRTGMPIEFVFTITRAGAGNLELSGELAISVLTRHGTRLFQIYSRHMGTRFSILPGTIRISAKVDSLPLAPGEYHLNLWLGAGDMPVHWLRDCFILSVKPGSFSAGEFVDNRGYPVLVPSTWEMLV